MAHEQSSTHDFDRLSIEQKRELLSQLVNEVVQGDNLQEVPLCDKDGNVRGYFVPSARRRLLREDTEFIRELERCAANPGKSIPWQEFKKTLEALGS